MAKKKKIGKVLIIDLLVIIIFEGFFIYNLFFKGDAKKILNDKSENAKQLQAMSSLWKNYKSVNVDYVGQIVFDSGLIDKPFVQATSCYKDNGDLYVFFDEQGDTISNLNNYCGNDVYTWMNFETMGYDYDNGGTIHMDYRNKMDDQNLILYGNFMPYEEDPDRKVSFSPLEALLSNNNFQDNRIVKLYLDKEIREYELFAVFEYDNLNDEFIKSGQYYRQNYNTDSDTGIVDEGYMNNYIDFVNAHKLYDTGVSLSIDDKTLTLQTRIVPFLNLYEICIFRQTSTSKY